MEIIKTFKFAANLEYVNLILKERKIPHFVDFNNLILSAEEDEKSKILKIINDLNLDENEVKVDENVLEGYKEWDKNLYNVGYYTGGKIPSFMNDKNNYLTYGFLILVTGLVCLVQIVNSKDFSKTLFWIFIILILSISFSMFYQYYKFKRKQNLK